LVLALAPAEAEPELGVVPMQVLEKWVLVLAREWLIYLQIQGVVPAADSWKLALILTPSLFVGG
jgi:hypothetical protein